MPASDAVVTDSEQIPENTEVTKLSVDLTDRKDGYSSVLYDNTNGLPTAEANAIAMTSDGFIWIGSYSGLIRYDGNTFERIDSTTGIASVVSLYVDSKDRLWIGTNDSGVAVMEKGSLRMYTKADGLMSSSIRSISEDADGNIYIATTHGMARIDNDLNLSLVDEPQINDEYIRSLKRGEDDVIYGVTADGDIFTMKDGRITGFYNGSKLGITDVHSLLPDPLVSGYVYIGTKVSGIFHVKLGDGFIDSEKIDVAPLEYINFMEQVENQVWVCADNGIGIIEGDRFIHLDHLPITSSAECLMIDYQGNVWITSSKQGVMKIVPNRFLDVFNKFDLSETVVNTTCFYNDCLFIGTKSEGLMIIDSNGNGALLDKYPVVSDIPMGENGKNASDLIKLLEGCRIRSIIKDNSDRLWISTYSDNALLQYDKRRVLRFSEKDGLPSDRIRTVCEMSDGRILVACSGGLAVIKDDKVVDVYDETTGLTNTEILTVAEGEDGDILAGTDGDGIYAINGSKLVRYGIEEGLSSEVVMRIKKDRVRDIYWIVTSNSIAYMDKNHKITTIKEFPYSNNFDLYENSKGEVWILSSNGIYVVPVDEIIANGKINPVFFGRDNGLPCIATANSYSALTEEGDLYIAGTTGVAKVNIEVDFDNVNNVKMAVPYVLVDGKRVYPKRDGTIVLPPNMNKLTICGYVFTYALMNPQVTYYLEGVDKEQTTVYRTDLKPADYNNLKGGNYRFIMKLKDSMTGGESRTLVVPLYKEPAFYETPWFIVVCAGLLAFLIYKFVQRYVNKRTDALMKKDEENKTFVREMIEAFAKTIDMKDKYTRGHSSRVAEYTAMLAREMSYDDDTVEKFYNIALLHDIGKIGVPPEVLNKPGKLTDKEFSIIKSHSALGYEVLKDISIMPELAVGAGEHHERPDGKGYPKGLKEDDISEVARIIAVADTFDAMYSDRPYRKRMNFDKAVSIIREVSGTQLSANVVDAFLRLVEEGHFRHPDDVGGGTTEDIDNIHKKYEKEEESKEEEPADKESGEQEPEKKESKEQESADKESGEQVPGKEDSGEKASREETPGEN
ncbi:MAG: HD domain-containing protein [Lachnospiraceae bacterium]|nr:HD domain-containing protein [Lachnospiraceae bacterium]